MAEMTQRYFPSQTSRRPAMKDVAAVAGISHQTVSRVLNDSPNVRPETRQRVMDAIAQLGYRRNTAARALVTQRSGTIGIVTTGSPLFGPTSTVISIERAAREAGLFVSLATVARWDSAALHTVLEHFMSQGVDGIVVVAAHDEAIAAVEAFDTTAPVVMVGPLSEPDEVASVAVDQYSGARIATRHLLDLGHATVVHVAGPTDWLDARERIRGWQDELVQAGIVRGEPIMAEDWSATSGYDVGRALIRSYPPSGGARSARTGFPSAIFAANDLISLGLLRAFAEADVSVPGDVSVVGFDDIDGSAHFFPPLTTVRQDFGLLGQCCVKKLLVTIEGSAADSGLVEPHLIERASTAPPTRGATG